MEKKFIAIVIALAVMLGVSNTSMSGMNDGSGGGYGEGVNFIDENGDGICDSLSRGDCASYIDEDGDGICDNSGGGRNCSGCDSKGNRGGSPLINITDGTLFTYTGEVTSVGYGGRGMVIEPDEEVDEEVIIYGLGPLWFWDCKNVSRPLVENMIEVTGYTVEYNDGQRNIAVSITIDDETIELRDPATGAPLWRGSNRWLCQ